MYGVVLKKLALPYYTSQCVTGSISTQNNYLCDPRITFERDDPFLSSKKLVWFTLYNIIFLAGIRGVWRSILVSLNILRPHTSGATPSDADLQAEVPGAFLSARQLRLAWLHMHLDILLLERPACGCG